MVGMLCAQKFGSKINMYTKYMDARTKPAAVCWKLDVDIFFMYIL
jgi:hypothetical protein